MSKQKPNKKNEPKKGFLDKVPSGGMKNSFLSNFVISILILFFVVSIYSLIAGNTKKEEISISELAKAVQVGDVKEISVKNGAVEAVFKNDIIKTSKKEDSSSITETLVAYGVTTEELGKIKVSVNQDGGFFYWLLNLSPILFPVLFIAIFIWMMTRQIKGAGMQAFSFGQSRARLTDPDDQKQKVTFKDVAGCKEAKEELSEIVDFLKNPKKFFEIGARIPKGILLMGAPGTGKTLLARAVAGEAGVAFFSISGSEFVEMFVGVGASRVRDLFNVAKKAAPAIIFMDEIDAVGRVRGGGMGGGNDEREQTLNQILVEMDGFEPAEKVVVMAATNRPDVLDPALLRPGRFDRRVTIDLPDRADREEILKIHSKEKPFAEDVNLAVVAERTPGFSGADLYSLMNEAAILAARENRTKVAQFDLVRSIEILSKKEKEITAYHEAGHALVASVLPYADPVHKISIISRGRAAGYTLKLPIEDRKLQSKNEFLDDIAMSLGGYVTEKMVFGDLTTGPSNDLQVSTALARDMVTKYGMSESLGPVALEGANGKALFGRGVNEKEYSEEVGALIDKEVSKIMKEAYNKAEKIITEHRPFLDVIAKRLIETESIERDEFESMLVANGISPKRKEELV
jgi:cell division protease FtsH